VYSADACNVARVSCNVALFRVMLQVFVVMLHVFYVLLHVFPVMLQETRATLHPSASAKYTKPFSSAWFVWEISTLSSCMSYS